MFLAQNPIPCLIMHSTVDGMFYAFSINGTPLQPPKPPLEEKTELLSPTIAREGNFHNCLMYLSNGGTRLVVLRLPTFERIKDIQLPTPATALCISDNNVFALLGHAEGICTLVGSYVSEPEVGKESFCGKR